MRLYFNSPSPSGDVVCVCVWLSALRVLQVYSLITDILLIEGEGLKCAMDKQMPAKGFYSVNMQISQFISFPWRVCS